ncbi:Efflux pump roqT [Penicillium rolfsii]|nr:Efflux pump roqT [Penicillium rolfsii]
MRPVIMSYTLYSEARMSLHSKGFKPKPRKSRRPPEREIVLRTESIVPAKTTLILKPSGNAQSVTDSRIIGLLVSAAVTTLVFAGVEIWKQDQGLLPPRFFRQRDVLAAMMFALFVGAYFYPIVYYIAIYFEAVQNNSAMTAGIKLLPLLVSVVITSILSGVYNPVILVETALQTAGAGLITTFSVHTPLRQWFRYQVLAGLGTGVLFQAAILVVQNTLGGTIFLAVAQTVFQNGIIDTVRRDAPGVNPHSIIDGGASDVRQILARMGRADAVDAVIGAYTVGFRNTFYLTAAAAGCTFLVIWVFSWKRIQKAVGTSEAEEAAVKGDSIVPENKG